MARLGGEGWQRQELSSLFPLQSALAGQAPGAAGGAAAARGLPLHPGQAAGAEGPSGWEAGGAGHQGAPACPATAGGSAVGLLHGESCLAVPWELQARGTWDSSGHMGLRWVLPPGHGTAHIYPQEQERSGATALETLKNHITGIFSPKYSVSPCTSPAALPS